LKGHRQRTPIDCPLHKLNRKALLESGAIPDDCVKEIAAAIPQTRSAVKFRPRSSKQCWARGWRAPEGKLSIHIVMHFHFPYPVSVRLDGAAFFHRQHHARRRLAHPLRPEFAHRGTLARCCQKPSKAWPANMDANKSRLMPLLAETYGANEMK
jgi:hypothetical protein